MAVDYGILFQNQPQVQPINKFAGVVEGAKLLQDTRKNEAQAKLAEAQASNYDLISNLKRGEVANKLLGAVMQHPTQENLMAAHQMAEKLGLDFSEIPTDINAALPFVQNAYVQSGEDLQRLKAAAELAMRQAQLTVGEAGANTSAAQAGLPAPFPNAPGVGFGGGMQASTTMPTGGGAVEGQQAQGVPEKLKPYLQSSMVSQTGPASLKEQEARQNDWLQFKQDSANAVLPAQQSQAFLESAEKANEKLGSAGTGPLVGFGTQYTEAGLRLTKDAANQQLAMVRTLPASGSRLAAEWSQLEKATFSPRNAFEVNKEIIAAAKTTSKWIPLQSEAVSVLEQYGIKDRQAALNILNRVYDNLDLRGKNGILRPEKLDNFWKSFENVTGIKTPYSQEYVNADGKTYNWKQLDKVAKHLGVTPEDVISQYGLNVKSEEPRGIRNNNPGNLIKTSELMPGEVAGNDNRFRTFESPQAGINALNRQLMAYSNRGLSSVGEIISTYAPPKENDTKRYTLAVAKDLGVKPFQKLNIKDPRVRFKLIKSIIKREQGKVPYSDDEIWQALG